jgi:hypothetical protein
MQFPKARISLLLTILIFSWNVYAQEKADREVEIHKNVRLIVLPPAPDLPDDFKKQYLSFIPIFQEALKENTTAETDECSMTLRVTSGFKEIGASKIKRPLARVTAFRKNSRQEYVAIIILHSYITSGLVNKEETVQFFKKQILEAAICGKAE